MHKRDQKAQKTPKNVQKRAKIVKRRDQKIISRD
jgi:uncharacterized protein (DUF3084 family)